jgi:hypothetical protein
MPGTGQGLSDANPQQGPLKNRKGNLQKPFKNSPGEAPSVARKRTNLGSRIPQVWSRQTSLILSDPSRLDQGASWTLVISKLL